MDELTNVYLNFHILAFDKHPLFSLLVFLVFIDIVLGYAKGWATKKWDSSKARKGLVTHSLLVVILMFVYPQVKRYGFTPVVDAFLVGFCLSYGGSIAANWRALGGWLPKGLIERLDYELKKHDMETDGDKITKAVNNVAKKIDKATEEKKE